MNTNKENSVTGNETGTPHHDGANTNTKEQSFWNWDDGTGVMIVNLILTSLFSVSLCLFINNMNLGTVNLFIGLLSMFLAWGASWFSLLLYNNQPRFDKGFLVTIPLMFVCATYVLWKNCISENPFAIQSIINNIDTLCSCIVFGFFESLIVCFVFLPLLQKRQRAR